MKPHDPRAVANLLLNLADEAGLAIDHIKLQKLLYFVHGTFLMRTGQPLLMGSFEAWQHGPVHPAVYRAFRAAGSKAIRFRGSREDIITGQTEVIQPTADPTVEKIVSQVLDALGPLTSSQLIDLSHVKDGPWHAVVEDMREGFAFGARIEHDAIRARFSRHKLVVTADAAHGEGSAAAHHSEIRIALEKPLTAAHGAR